MKPINFYEVTEKDPNNTVWGGSSALQAVEWYRRGLDYKVFVSVWDEQDEEEPRLITDKVEVTRLIQASLMEATK